MPSLYQPTPETGTVSTTNLTSLYSNTTNFTTGLVTSAVNSVNGGTGVTVNPTTGNVVVSIGQDVATSANVTFANVTATGNLSNNYYTLANAVGTNGQVLTTNGAGATSWTALSSIGVTSITGTANQVIASSPTGAITLSTPQDIATTSNPTFAGATLGNILVATGDNNTISTTVGDLILDGFSGIVNMTNLQATLGGAAPLNGLNLYSNDATNAVHLYDDYVQIVSGTNGDWVFNEDGTTDFPNYKFPVADGTANQVLTTNGAGIVSWALPGGGGSTFGNVTVGIVTDNTISTTSGDLEVAATGNNGVNITSGSDGPTLITRNSSTTNTNIRSLGLNSRTSGTPATGIGNSIEFNVETAVGVTTTGGYLSVTSTDITPGSEDFKMSFGLMAAGAVYTEVAALSSVGDLQIDGDLTVTGNNINSSSATALNLSGDDVTVVGDLGVAGGTVATTAVTGNLFNTTATTLNIGGAATAVNIGANTGSTIINADLNVNGTTLTLDANNAGAGANSTIAANRGSSGADATLTWTESTGFWSFSNDVFAAGSVIGGTSIGTNGNNINFNNEDGSPAADCFITVKKPGVGDPQIKWNEATLRWQTTVDGSTYLNIPNQNLDTTDSPAFAGVNGGNVTVGVDTDQTISTTSGDLILQTAAGVNTGTITINAGAAGNIVLTPNTTGDVHINTDNVRIGDANATATLSTRGTGNLVLTTNEGSAVEGTLTFTNGANGNATFAPNGSGSVALTLANGGNLTNTRNYVLGAIRNATTASNGEVFTLGSAGTGYKGISLDNSADTTDGPVTLMRSFTGGAVAAAGTRGRLIFERARGTSASPTAVQSADQLGSFEGTGYTSTGWLADTLAVMPAVFNYAATENWVSNTNLGTQATLLLAPSATTISTGANLVSVLAVNPQTFASRSDAFTWANGKTGTTQTMALDVSGNLTVTGDVRVNGNDIQGSGGTTAISLTSANTATTVRGDTINLANGANTATNLQLGSTFANFASAGTNYAAMNTSSTTFTNTGLNTFIRQGTVNTVQPALTLRYQRTDTANPNDGDGVDFRLGLGGTSTNTNIARFDAVYKTSGLHQFGISVSTDSFAADTDTIYRGQADKTIIRATPTGTTGTASDILTVESTKVTSAVPIAFPSYTAAAANAITGAVGWQIAISDSPINAGKMAYWDTTNARWSYIDTNTAV